MRRGNSIGLDTHVAFSEMAVVNGGGAVIRRDRCNTTITQLRAMLETIARPRHLVIEEGPLANWLYRNLKDSVDTMTVAEPRRNRLIANDGDKDDPVDAEKLAQLRRGGYIKAVHQTDSLDRSVFKQLVATYHRQVRRRVAVGHQITSLFKQHGVMARARHIDSVEERAKIVAQLPLQTYLRDMMEQLCREYDHVVGWEVDWRRRLLKEAKRHDDIIRRLTELPGISWVRAATLVVYLDTPWRFRSPKALWKYLGIGLERRRSGNGPEILAVPKQVNRLLKSTILGAAKSAIAQGDNPFADQYRRWIDEGLSPKMAKRNVARSLAATLWGLWKSGEAYHPEWVGVNLAATRSSKVSL